QQHRHRLGPGCGAVEHVAAEHSVGDDHDDDHEAQARDEETRAMKLVHRPDVVRPHCFFPRQRTSRPGPAWGPRRLTSDAAMSHFTSWMRWIGAACWPPYLSHTGLTAAWNGLRSVTSLTWAPASLIFFSDSSSRSYQSFLCSCCASLESLVISAW